MQTFKDSMTGKVYAFEEDVVTANANGVYSFATASGKPLKTPATLQPYTPPAPTTAELLATAQAAQMMALNAACARTIKAGFTSSALGTPYIYPSTPQDQANLLSAVTAGASAPPGWTTPFWCEAAGTWSLIQHTAAQIIQVHSDFQAMMSGARVRLAALVMAVQAATSIAAVQAEKW